MQHPNTVSQCSHRLRPWPSISLKPVVVNIARPVQRQVSGAAITAVATDGAMSLSNLVLASTLPVAKVALFCLVGAWAAGKGLLPAEARVSLSGLNFRVFTPCLMFSKLAVGQGLAETFATWPLTANMVMSHVFGLVLGLLVARVVAPPAGLNNHVVLASTIGNVGNMPFLMAGTLAADPGLPFVAIFGAAAAEIAQRYVALSNLSASLIQFPLAYLMLRLPQAQQQQQQQDCVPCGDAAASMTSRLEPLTARQDSSSSGPGLQEPHSRLSNGNRTSSEGNSCVVVDEQVRSSSSQAIDNDAQLADRLASQSGSSSSSSSGGSHGSGTQQTPVGTTLPPHSRSDGDGSHGREHAHSWWDRWGPVVKGIITPPTIACCLALVVASNPPLQAVLYTPGAPLALISEVVEMLGALTIPCLLMVLGANLAKGPGVGTIPISCIAGVALSRLVLLPLVCAAVVLWSASSGLLGPMGRDPLAVLVMLLMNCTPSAVLTHAMATLQRNKPDEAAAMLFWQYAVALIVLPISIGACLQVCRVAAC